jgi:hypothetical protein
LELDFGPGPVAYKKLWSNDNAITTVSYRFSGSLLGAIAMKGWEWRRRWRIFRKQIPERNPVGEVVVDASEPVVEELG